MTEEKSTQTLIELDRIFRNLYRKNGRVERDIGVIEKRKNIPTNGYTITRNSYNKKWYGIEGLGAKQSIVNYRIALKCLDLYELRYECYAPHPDEDDCCVHFITTEEAINNAVRKSNSLQEFLSTVKISLMDFVYEEIDQKLQHIDQFYDVIDLLGLSDDESEPIPVNEVDVENNVNANVISVNIDNIDDNLNETKKCLNICEQGKAQICERGDNEKLEDRLLELYVNDSWFIAIAKGKKKYLDKNIYNDKTGRKVFKTNEDGAYIVNGLYKDIRRTWKVTCRNNGAFPFVLRRYPAMKLLSKSLGFVTVRIENETVKLSTDGKYWQVKYKLGEVTFISNGWLR